MVWKKMIFAIATLVLLVAILSGLMVSPALGQQPERVKVLIGFTRQPGPAEEVLVRGVGGTIRYTYHLVPAIAATVPERAIDGLRRNPNVTSVDLDGQVWAVDTELDNAWGVKRIGTGSVHDSGNKGLGVKVAIIDSGIDYNHPDLDANYAGGHDFVDGDDDPMDVYGHGTHVAGTACAEDNDNGVDDLTGKFGVVGVAPECALYSLRVLNDDGVGFWSDIIAAMEWAVDNGMQVANLSLGHSIDPGGTVEAAFNNAEAAGLVIVAAAGNDGNPPGKGNSVIYPAEYDSVIAVAATDSNDNRASWSSTGDQVELAAPGVSVFSTWNDSTSPHDPQPVCHTEEDKQACYKYGSGTSMASPHVAGTAALVIAAGITDTNGNGQINDEVRQRLDETADDLGDPGRDPQYGYGLVDADEAAGEVVSITDIAITAISAPSSVVQGDTVSVDVTVENVGNQAVTSDINVTLVSDNATPSDTGDDITIGTQTISGGLAAGASTTLTFSWDTGGASFGDHTLTASHDFADDYATNDSKSTTVTVTEPGATMHVGDLDGSKELKGKSGRWEVFVSVAIHDENDGPVAGATVTGEWSGAVTGTVSGTTGSDGTVTFSTGNMSGGTGVTFTVTGVTHDMLTYDATANHDPDGDSDGTSITVSK